MLIHLFAISVLAAFSATPSSPSACDAKLVAKEMAASVAVPGQEFAAEAWRYRNFDLQRGFDYQGFVSARRLAEGHLDQRDAKGRTALMHAAAAQNKSFMWALLRNGASVHLRDPTGQSAADHSTLLRLHQIRTDLQYVERDLTLEGVYAGDAVRAAIAAPDLVDLENLLKRGLNPDFYDLSLGRSLLTYAAAEGNLDRMRLLLRYGANPQFRMRNGDGPICPVIAAASKCQIGALKLLIEHGATINDGAYYSYEINPVQQAIWDYRSGNEKCDKLGTLDWLLANGALPDANVAESTIHNKQTVFQMIDEHYFLDDRYGPEESLNALVLKRKAEVLALLQKYGWTAQ